MSELAVVLAIALSSQFDASDTGIGARVGWQPVPLVGIEAEVVQYPSDFPQSRPFSRGRLEGLFGVTVGPRLNRVRPFARVRPGFVRVGESPQPFACIKIFPPPLACVLASGQNLFALDIGGGVDISISARTFVRVDAGDRLLRYPGPVFAKDFTRQDAAFVSHELRFAGSGGIRF